MNAFNAIVGALVLVVIFSLLCALPVMWLWDWLMPTIFNLKEITLFQAWGLSALCGLLFKNNTSK
jgi:uncharacterized membrane protein